jgi:signal transduction histidine kinase
VLDTQKEIDSDVLAVGHIDAVPTLLEILCNTTGMGFAAVARVSADTWTACVVRDAINLGIAPGGQLEVATTLCFESREARKPIVIDHVAEDPLYRNHHTPRIYGFQSYISVPIILANGDYFGNLCAIDPKPIVVSNPKVVSMFQQFAQLIADQLDLKKVSASTFATLLAERDVCEMRDLFVEVLGRTVRQPMQNLGAIVEQLDSPVAAEIRAEFRRVSRVIDEALDFSNARFGQGLPVCIQSADNVEQALNEVIEEIQRSHPEARIISNITVRTSVRCDLDRVTQLLTLLLRNALDHGASHGPISAVATLDAGHLVIEVWNDGESITAADREHIFAPTWRRGLYLCRQIAEAHAGSIAVLSREGEGTLFTTKLPICEDRA